MFQPATPTELDQPGLPFTLEDRLAIRAVALSSEFRALEVNVAMNHPAYFEAAEVFVHGRSDLAFIIWRSATGIRMEEIFGDMNKSVAGGTMSEIFDWLASFVRVSDHDSWDWSVSSAFEAPSRLH